jgi:crotonyl-CoA carboxylase/reductase
LGGLPIAVVSSEEKKVYCQRLGAVGCLNRHDYTHWGAVPPQEDKSRYDEWFQSLRAFGKAIHECLGERRRDCKANCVNGG